MPTSTLTSTDDHLLAIIRTTTNSELLIIMVYGSTPYVGMDASQLTNSHLTQLHLANSHLNYCAICPLSQLTNSHLITSHLTHFEVDLCTIMGYLIPFMPLFLLNNCQHNSYIRVDTITMQYSCQLVHGS